MALTVPQNMVVNLLWVVLEEKNDRKLTVIRNYDMLQTFLFISHCVQRAKQP